MRILCVALLAGAVGLCSCRGPGRISSSLTTVEIGRKVSTSSVLVVSYFGDQDRPSPELELRCDVHYRGPINAYGRKTYLLPVEEMQAFIRALIENGAPIGKKDWYFYYWPHEKAYWLTIDCGSDTYYSFLGYDAETIRILDGAKLALKLKAAQAQLGEIIRHIQVEIDPQERLFPASQSPENPPEDSFEPKLPVRPTMTISFGLTWLRLFGEWFEERWALTRWRITDKQAVIQPLGKASRREPWGILGFVLERVQYFNFPELATDADLAVLEHVKNIQRLDLSFTQITDAGLTNLAGLTHLELLILRFTKITDAGLVHLKGLKHLHRLVLDGTPVTDAGLVTLAELQQLEWVSLCKTKITNLGRQNLESEMPHTKVYGTR